VATRDNPDSQTYYHGTTADLKVGDAAPWGAELGVGKGHSPDQLKEMHDHLESLKQRGVEAIEE
jgi:hypothetical protein